MHFSPETGTSTELSFIRTTGINLGVLFYVWAFVILTASSHSVNLTDGLDGLASGSSILVLSAFMFIAFWQFRHACGLGPPEACYAIDPDAALDTAIVAAAMMGAVTGFLWWNAAPARIFMGDTGSLALGGVFGALAITLNTQLLLIVLGGLFVIETMSVILQVISFRGFGRRIFRMSPIHHHFELAGWPEFTVIVRFWIIAGLCVAVGIGLFYVDFISKGGLGMNGDFEVRGRRVVVIGAAVAGTAAAEVLALEGADVLVSEARPADQLDTLPRLPRAGRRGRGRWSRSVAPRRRDARGDRSRRPAGRARSFAGPWSAASPCGESWSSERGSARSRIWP